MPDSARLDAAQSRVMLHDPPIVLWIGRFSTHDGYGTAARQHVSALRDAGVPVVAADLRSRRVVGSVPDGLVDVESDDRRLRIAAKDPRRQITAIVHDRPDLFPRVHAAGRSRLIGYSYWEATRLPPGWSGWMASMDRMWTSSDFNVDAFVAAGVPRWMIDRVGHPLDPLALEIGASRESLRARWPESTVFLSVVSGSAGRRDINMLVEAFAMAFDQHDDVALVLKVPEDGDDGTAGMIERTMATMPARGSGRWPRVYVLASTMTREQLLRLHGSVDCYVSCERGNGWDLPAMDSMTMGIPVVAPNFGASTMFLRPEDGYVVPVSTKLIDCDGAFDGEHPLYSGQYWPYVDPGAFAAELRRVHDDAADRRARGAAVSARIRREYDTESIAADVRALTSTASPIDVRSNAAAVVSITRRSGGWAPANEVPAFESNGALHDAVLLGLLNDPDFLRPRDPRRFLRAYKAASEHARAYGAATSAGPVRDALASAMTTSAAHPIRKSVAVANLRMSVPRATRRAGDADELRALADVVDDYRRTLTGQSSRFSPEAAETARRRFWTRYGPFRSPKPDLDRLADLRDRHRGERVFVLGNGPSLLACDLSRLGGEHTFGVNKIHLLFDRIDWRPSFYTLLDWKMGAAMRDDIDQLDGSIKFFPERFRGVLPAGPDVFWYWPRPVGPHVDDQFEPNMVKGIPSRATVLVTAIQQAFHLGFREIVLVGVDASYRIPDTVRQSGPDQFGTGTKLHLESTADDDPNHFSNRYFGKGDRWHDPNVDDMRRMFRLMRKGVERHGGRLLNATVGGELEELERVDFDALFTR